MKKVNSDRYVSSYVIASEYLTEVDIKDIIRINLTGDSVPVQVTWMVSGGDGALLAMIRPASKKPSDKGANRIVSMFTWLGRITPRTGIAEKTESVDVILSILMVSLPVLFNVNVECLNERMNTPPKLTKAGITEMLDISGLPVPLTYIVSGEDRALLAMITEALA